MKTENGSGWGSRSHLHVLALMAATALGIYLCYRMALPFVTALTWALTLAVLFMPVHRWLESTVRHSNLAASVSVLVIGLIVVVPATFVGQRLVSEAVTGADTIRAKVESGSGSASSTSTRALRPSSNGSSGRLTCREPSAQSPPG